MAGADRRDVLKWAGASALASLAGFAIVPPVAAANRPIIVPAGTMRLSRRVTRELDPQVAIVVTREWRIAFSHIEGGWLVSGDMVAVDVDVPPALNALADIERQRDTPECFPIELDESGLIRRSDGPQLSLDLDTAAHEAELVLTANGSDISKQRDLRSFVSQLQMSASSLITRFPQDLFFPSGDDIVEKREMTLPGGITGLVRMDYSAKLQQGSQLLRSSVRTITTSVGGETRRSVEEWNLLLS